MIFYKNGLRFSCAFCGKCCRIKDGYVWLSRGDVDALVAGTGISEEDFRGIYTETVDGAVVLKDFPNGDCIFFDESIGCKVYSARPLQCRTFPFWPENLRDENSWRKAAEFCPGIGSGEKHDFEEIMRNIASMKGMPE